MTKRSLLVAAVAVVIAGGVAAAALGRDMLVVERAKRYAARDLFDPSSAQFRDVRSRPPVVCGEINGKNRNGAYVGFTRFITDTKTGSTWMVEPDPPTQEDLQAAVDAYGEEVSRAQRSGVTAGARYAQREAHDKLERFKAYAEFEGVWATKCVGDTGAQKVG